MCYSAQIQQEYRKYVRMFGAHISIREYVELYWERAEGSKAKIPKAIDAWFTDLESDDHHKIRTSIERFNQAQRTSTEQVLFTQRTRLAKAERALEAKPTKAAAEDKRISQNKIQAALRKLEDLQRVDLHDSDARIFPGGYAPVLIVEDGKRVIKPMRYLCRPAGKPASYDIKFPGIYNARRDNLEGFWKGLFGYTHGVMLANVFYENVERSDGNVVLEFRPDTKADMLVACLWSRWTAEGQPDLLSFAAITDEPPPEVAATGHTRFVVPIKEKHLDAWLNPNPANLDALYAILDDRERPYYEHRLAA